MLGNLADQSSVTMRIWSEDDISGHTLVTDVGRLDIDTIVSDVADRPEPHFLLSGPPAMLKAFSHRLQVNHNVESNRIHIDEWE